VFDTPSPVLIAWYIFFEDLVLFVCLSVFACGVGSVFGSYFVFFFGLFFIPIFLLNFLGLQWQTWRGRRLAMEG